MEKAEPSLLTCFSSLFNVEPVSIFCHNTWQT